MYFLLDKDYAVNNIVRCIGASSKPFTDDEIKLAKETYNTKETIVFIGDDIPHHIEFDSTLNTIVEKLPVEEEEVATLSVQDEVVEEPKVFNEDVEVESGVFYFYIDKNIADTEYRTETIATFTKPLLNPKEYLQKEVYEVKGTDIPFYITIEKGKVRESTKYEQYLRGQYQLQDREVEYNGDIIYLEEGWYIENKELKKVPKPDDTFKPVFNEVSHIWEEKATLQEQEEYHNRLIDTLKAELLEDGFIYPDKTKVKHQQKCRDKDLSYLGNAIASMEDAGIPTMKWYFNNGDMVELTLEEMKELRANGAIFVSIVFGVEAQLKAEQPTKNLTLTMFKDKVDAISTIKCFRDK